MSTLAAVILAAGQSKRMGQPKMLLPWGRTSVLGQVIDTLAASGAQEIIVVTGGSTEAVEAEAALHAGGLPLRCVHNPQYAASEMLSSLRCGLAALGPGPEATLVALGDQPQLSPGAVRQVVEAYGASPAGLIVPSHDLRRGHPWLVRRELWAELLALQPPLTLRDFLNTHAADILYVETDATVLKDLDTPEDYQREKP